jgi:hypothetical protein
MAKEVKESNCARQRFRDAGWLREDRAQYASVSASKSRQSHGHPASLCGAR